MRLLLVRHGETDWNMEGRWQGQTDIPLNDRGRKQAEFLGQHLRHLPIHSIYTSDLRRAYDTAAAINVFHGHNLNTDDRLREIYLGRLEGLTRQEIGVQFPDYIKRQFDGTAFHGGETHLDLAKRVESFLRYMVEQGPQDQTHLVVSHGGPLRMMVCVALELPLERYLRFRKKNTSVTELRYENHQWLLIRMNETTHLRLNGQTE